MTSGIFGEINRSEIPDFKTQRGRGGILQGAESDSRAARRDTPARAPLVRRHARKVSERAR